MKAEEKKIREFIGDGLEYISDQEEIFNSDIEYIFSIANVNINKDDRKLLAEFIIDAINEKLQKNKTSDIGAKLLIEFGYKQCEKGNNLDAAFIEYQKLTKQP